MNTIRPWASHPPSAGRDRPRRTLRFSIGLFAAIVVASAAGRTQAPELGQGWLPEFNLAARQLLQLAEATPAEKFSWRPGPDVRSTSELYMHVALGNFFLLGQAGVKVPVDPATLPKNDKTVTEKAAVIKWLTLSLVTVRDTYPGADKQKKVTFFGRETVADSVLLRLLVHNHEHMGQAIAYARSSGVVPPWSK